MRTINKYRKLFFAISLIAILTSCKESNLDLTNPNDVNIDNFWKSESEALIGLAGVYDAYQYNQLAGQRYRQMEIISDNAQVVNDNGWAALEGSTHNSAVSTILQFWAYNYNVVNRANLVIRKVTDMPLTAITESSKKRIIAEASFLRANAYLDLTALFGDIPFYLEPVNPLGEAKGKTPKAQIWDFLIKDLIDNVIPNLPATVSVAQRGRIRNWASKALLGKYYLYNSKWTEAAAQFKEIIDSKQFSLYPDYARLFTPEGEYSSENLFEIGFIEGGVDAGEAFSVRIDTNLAPIVPSASYTPSANLVESYSAIDGLPITGTNKSPLYNAAQPYVNRDPRLRATIFTNLDRSPTKRYWNNSTTIPFAVKKYTYYSSVQFPNNQGPQNYYMMRYADVLLLYAEAKNEASAPDLTVYDAVTTVRKRAGILPGTNNLYGLKAAMTQAEMRTVIRNERRWEFALEHQRFYDLRRWGIIEQVIVGITPNPRGKKFTSPRDLLWPYPLQEMDNNPILKAEGQNPGW